MKTLKFKNNDRMPALGLGTWKSKPGDVYDAVKTAIKAGYRHIDCAPIYGNEKEVGKAISECIAEGIVSRAELWVTSKLWNNNHRQEDVLPALTKTLADLQLSYLDLYLIHWPVALKKEVLGAQSAADFLSLKDVPIAETWKGMEEAVKLGLAKHIGVCNFGKKRLEDLIANSIIKPEMLQVESHPYLQQESLLNFCKANDINYTAYSPLGSLDRPKSIKKENEPKLLDDSVIASIATQHHTTPAMVLLSWALQRGTCAIPKSVNPDRIAQNLQAGTLTLSDTDMKAIAGLEKGYRYVSGEFLIFENGPFTLTELWE